MINIRWPASATPTSSGRGAATILMIIVIIVSMLTQVFAN